MRVCVNIIVDIADARRTHVRRISGFSEEE